MTDNVVALLSGFKFEKQKSKIYFMDAQSYFDSQAYFNKWLKQLTEDEQRMIVDMLNEFRQQNLQQCNVSGSLPIDLLRKAYHAGMVEAIKRTCAEFDNYEYKQVSFDMWLNSVTEAGGNDR